MTFCVLLVAQTSPEHAMNIRRRHEAFISTLDANDEKINEVVNTAEELIRDNNYAADKVQQKSDALQER